MHELFTKHLETYFGGHRAARQDPGRPTAHRLCCQRGVPECEHLCTKTCNVGGDTYVCTYVSIIYKYESVRRQT